ncbi:MAG: DUF488 domain-containing protein [Gammaproteobacteria bacterium]|nr:DUF488 domain-containing protein [Gammaproteobacteria bacterium]MYF50560.1 DUF488 domain-containing protein [Gammaproteobacteria bacterium]
MSMFYRRKVLLALVEELNRQVPKTDLQKYLFLVSRQQENPSYDFVPYRFGCYSFNADADKRALTKRGLIRDHDKWVLDSPKQYMDVLRQSDQRAVRNVVGRFGQVRGRNLVHYVYQADPYYAINSKILNDVLNPAEKASVEASRPQKGPPHLFTIGYEGKSLEQFLNALIRQSVSVLCDVRRNPLSRKYGFSKRTLQQACKGIGMDYIHKPELGIDSRKRRHLQSPADYRSLFRDYRATTLVEGQKSLDSIARLVIDRGRVALTCFEAASEQCHRGCVADALLAKPDFGYGVTHL